MAPSGSTAAFAHSGFFVLRAPVLPFDTLTAAQSADGDTGEAGRARLRRLLDLPAVSEAVFVASPSLHAQLGVWRREGL